MPMDPEAAGASVAERSMEPPADEESDLSPEERDHHGELAAEELIAAVHSGNRRDVWTAFKALEALCDEEEGETPEE